MTETADFVQSLWEALPYQYRELGYSGHMQDKMEDLYNHWNKVDMVKALKNVASNQLEDYAYGYLPSKYGKDINKSIFPTDQRGVQLRNTVRNSYIY